MSRQARSLKGEKEMGMVYRAETTFAKRLSKLVDDELLNFFVNQATEISAEESREYWDFLLALKKAIKGTVKETDL